MDKVKPSVEKPVTANEAEGNRTAARAYDAQATKFAKSGRVDSKAREAAAALDGPEAKELARAESEGMRGNPHPAKKKALK
jgi:hypothetical protein